MGVLWSEFARIGNARNNENYRTMAHFFPGILCPEFEIVSSVKIDRFEFNKRVSRKGQNEQKKTETPSSIRLLNLNILINLFLSFFYIEKLILYKQGDL